PRRRPASRVAGGRAEIRLGVLGGTFNPIHVGHLVFAESFRERLALDRVLFVPAGAPPHKPAKGIAPAIDRYAMVSLAVAGHPAFAASATRWPGPDPRTLPRPGRGWPASGGACACSS